MIAVIRTGGKQYDVQKGDRVRIEKISGEAGDAVVFDDVLLLGDAEKVSIGTPQVDGASVCAKILEQGRAAKVTGIKHKPKKRYKVKFGHRQPFTEIEITEIKGA